MGEAPMRLSAVISSSVSSMRKTVPLDKLIEGDSFVDSGGNAFRLLKGGMLYLCLHAETPQYSTIDIYCKRDLTDSQVTPAAIQVDIKVKCHT